MDTRHAESLGVDAIATIPPITSACEILSCKYWNDISVALKLNYGFTIFLVGGCLTKVSTLKC